MTTLHHYGQNFQILLKNYQAYFNRVKNISEAWIRSHHLHPSENSNYGWEMCKGKTLLEMLPTNF